MIPITITELPAWETQAQERQLALGTRLVPLKVFEEPERDRIKIASRFPSGSSPSLYLSLSVLRAFFDALPNTFRSTSIHGLSESKRGLLIAFLIADERFGCCPIKLRGYLYIIKKPHPLYRKCIRKRFEEEEDGRSRILNPDL